MGKTEKKLGSLRNIIYSNFIYSSHNCKLVYFSFRVDQMIFHYVGTFTTAFGYVRTSRKW